MNIAFIGLGIMGSRMATNLLKNDVNLTVYNRTKEVTESLKGLGANVANSVAQAVEGADIVFSMLSTPEVVEELFLGTNGALSQMKKNSIWADCTTVNPSFSQKAAQAAHKVGIQFLDTPVAGTKPHAENAELVFFVGGEKKSLQVIEPFLHHMGKKVLPIGAVSKGAAFKMLVNVLLAQSMVIFSETVLLGKSMGLSEDFLLQTLPNLAVSAPFTQAKAKMIADGDYSVQFPLEWMQKDLHLATLTAYELQQPLHLANMTKELFAAANQKGMSRLDFAAIYEYLKQQ